MMSRKTTLVTSVSALLAYSKIPVKGHSQHNGWPPRTSEYQSVIVPQLSITSCQCPSTASMAMYTLHLVWGLLGEMH